MKQMQGKKTVGVDLASLTGHVVGSPRFAKSVRGSWGAKGSVLLRPAEGFRLVIVPVQAMAPRGRLLISNVDFSAVAEDGERYRATAVGWGDGIYAVPNGGSKVLISRTCEEPTRLTLKAVFTVPAEARCFQLRFAAPVAEVTLD